MIEKSLKVFYNHTYLKKWIRNELENSIVLYYTGTSRDSAKIIEEQIRCQSQAELLNGMNELKHQAILMKESILKGDFDGFGDCLRAGWQAKKKTSSVITNPRIERMYDFAMENGGKAAKISGAGGGGFMMIVCDPKRRYELVQKLNQTEGKVFLATFTERGAQAWTLY